MTTPPTMRKTGWEKPYPDAKGFLADFTNPNNRLLFQYNPTEIHETREVEWPEIAIPGADDALANFGSGRNLKLAFQLFFNSYGEGGKSNLPKRGGNEPITVEDALAFLHGCTETTPTTDPYQPLAPKLLLFWFGEAQFGTGSNYYATAGGPSLLVRVTNLSVKRGFFSRDKLKTRRAMVDIELTRHALFPR